jgi:uncharacterized protein
MQSRNGETILSPSDVTGYLACAHLTALSLQVAEGTFPRAERVDEQRDLIFRKGMEHEHAYLQRLRDSGKRVVEIPDAEGDWSAAVTATIDAMRDGPDVIYQGVFVNRSWRGVADFLMRVDAPSELGAWSYEALDTKLARHSKPAYILQLCFYDEQIARIQGRKPEHIHVLLGSGEQESFRPHEFGAYYRRVRSRLEAFVADPPRTEAYPCAHCDMCDFKGVCDAHWDSVDHLSRVAGMRSTQIERLAAAGLTTLAALARAPENAPAGVPSDTYEKLREQASLQLHARETGRDAYRLLKPGPESGFALLPPPSVGDLFFDFEGNPFWDSEGGLEYLWGILDVDHNFTPLHAHDHATEKVAFETFIDLVHERLVRFPDLHVYHYAQYEVTALRRLMGRYGTREAELDDLLRREVFVDLFRVVRNGLRTSRPRYGLKDMEAFLAFERHAEVKDGGTSIVIFEQWMQTREDALLRQIDEYNREDCLATLLLRDWLLELRADALAEFGPFPQPEPPEVKPTSERRLERTALRQRLLDAGEEVAAQLLDYHERERKPTWWAFFDRIEMTPSELVEDPESIGRLEPVGEPVPEKRSKAFTFRFPAQEHKIGQGQEVIDPATGDRAGDVLAVDRERHSLVLKRGPKLDDTPLPEALVPGGPFRTNDQEEALARLGRSLLARDRAYPALESILRRERFDQPVQTNDLEAMKLLVRSLDGQHLVIQGPPGSGKTWTSGRLIADLIHHGQRVGVASTSHKAIHNLLDAVEDASTELGIQFEGRKKASAGNPDSVYENAHIESVTDAAACSDCDLIAGTAWLFSRADHEQVLDYLFIDEAGQVALADALAMGTAARNVVLVGDPQQLAQVIQGTHPSGTEASVLQHLLAGEATIPADRGVFLGRTFRLHPNVCAYISEEFYDGRLSPDASAAQRTTPVGTGLRYLPVDHSGCRQESMPEVEVVAAEIARLTAAGVAPHEIIVVAPYNAQVNLLRESLPEAVRVGTVDKFQGQESRVVLYSMASSSGEEIPRGLEFLLSRNRLNVALSRSQCLAYLVCSPRLLEVDCRTIEHMRLANALCRYVEMAS